MARWLALAMTVLLLAAAGGRAESYGEARYDVDVTSGVVYGTGAVDGGRASIDLLLDLYLPVGASEARKPVLVTIHGGGFRSGSRQGAQHVSQARFFAARGFAAISIDYRLEGDAPLADPDMVALGTAYDPTRSAANHAAVHAGVVDTKTALRWVHAHAEEYGLDPDRVFVVGSSAGGFCAVVAGITAHEQFSTDLPREAIPAANHPGWDADVQGIVNLWGGAGPWIDEIDADDPPMMLVYGTEDWLYPEGEALRDRCADVAATYEWVPLEGYGHGAWDAPIHGMSRGEAMLDFLDRHGVLAPAAEGAPATGTANAIPWGAMYTPNEHLVDGGMTGAVKSYRGERGAARLLEDLAFARAHGVRLILTLGSVAPLTYLTPALRIDMARVRAELDPFFAQADAIRPYIEDGTIWGIRFLDEPHDPAGLPRGATIDPAELGAVYALIDGQLGPVRVASTAPPSYMVEVPGADFSFGQCLHARFPGEFESPTAFHRHEAAFAHAHGLLYVASLNANTNEVGNLAFFTSYLEMCAIPEVDFVTAWQWPQGHHPMPSFGARFADPDPAVQALLAAIPAAAARD